MKIKKVYDDITIYFDVLGDNLTLENETVLTNILDSIQGFKFIHKDKQFNELVKEQQKHNKHIIVPFEPEPHDELKFKIKAIYNFLVETNQHKNFLIDSIELPLDNNSSLFLHGVEILQKNITTTAGISPTIRAEWTDPILVEKILKMR